MELNVRLPTGESVPVAVATDATVGDVKQALQDIKGVSPVHQKMSLSGKRLKDRAVLAEAGLSSGDEVDVRVGLNGGCDCCVNLCKALLILILFPFILLIMLFGILVWILFLPFYLIAKVPPGQFLLIGVFQNDLRSSPSVVLLRSGLLLYCLRGGARGWQVHLPAVPRLRMDLRGCCRCRLLKRVHYCDRRVRGGDM